MEESRAKIEALKSQDYVTMLRKAEDELENLRDEKSRLETQLGLALSGEEKAKNQLKTYIEGEGDRTKEELETVKKELEQKRQDGEESEAMWKERVTELQKVSTLVTNCTAGNINRLFIYLFYYLLL